MSIKKTISTVLTICSTFVYGQTGTVAQDSVKKPEIKISYLDSIKSTFIKDKTAARIDSLWMNEITSLEGFNELLADIENVDVDKKVDYDLSTDLLKERLKQLDEKSPFNIEYNIGLENVIKSFLKNRKKTFERLLGISQYYFPLFEDELAKNNIPLEIKYLAVVESALNPRATSRVGATGLWQFMYQTGKQYGLNIDSYVDERSDPLKASQAASQYMNNMYKIFGDWDLVLAAYNSGPGNVTKAIRRSGGKQNYWNIRKNLPRETQGYLPAFLATMYIFEYHKEHGIVPDKAVANLYATDTIMVKKHMTFKQVSDLLDVPVAEIQFFNPSYKRSEIPHVTGQKNFLRLPKSRIAVFTSNEDKIYAYIDHKEKFREKPIDFLAEKRKNDSLNPYVTEFKMVNKTKFHKVKRGDDLSDIAAKYDVSVAEIKKWNRLKSNSISRGKLLKIQSNERVAVKVRKPLKEIQADSTRVAQVETKVIPKKEEVAFVEPKADKVFKTEKVVKNKEVTKYYKVKKGDNLSEIASKYDVSVAEIKKWNHLKSNTAPKGKNLKIVKEEQVVTLVKKEVKQPVESKKEVVAVVKTNAQTISKSEVEQYTQPKEDKVFKTEKVVTNKDVTKYHKVKKGENISEIASNYDVSVANIKKWNHLRKNTLIKGTNLKIVTTERVVTTVKKEVKQPINSKNDDNVVVENHTSKTGKNKEDRNNNDLRNEKHYVVGKGESLYSIAKEMNVSVDDLKQWNDMPDNNVRQGMELIYYSGKNNTVADTNSDFNIIEYTVVKGDNLSSIAKRNHTTIEKLKEWNNLSDINISLGNVLIVKKTEIAKNDKVSKWKKESIANNEKKIKGKVYEVKKGDTLYTISKKFPGVTIADIKKWNNITSESLTPGMKLKING